MWLCLYTFVFFCSCINARLGSGAFTFSLGSISFVLRQLLHKFPGPELTWAYMCKQKIGHYYCEAAVIKPSAAYVYGEPHSHDLQRAQWGAADIVSVCCLCCRRLVGVFVGVCVCQVACSPSHPQDEVKDSLRYNECRWYTASAHRLWAQCALLGVRVLCFVVLCRCYKQCERCSRMTHTTTEWDDAQKSPSIPPS